MARSLIIFVHFAISCTLTHKERESERAEHLPNFHICLCIFHIFLFCIPFTHEYFISLHSLILFAHFRSLSRSLFFRTRSSCFLFLFSDFGSVTNVPQRLYFNSTGEIGASMKSSEYMKKKKKKKLKNKLMHSRSYNLARPMNSV